MTRRRLRPDEVELWQKVTERTERLHPERTAETPLKSRPKPKPEKPVFNVNEPFTLGSRASVSPAPHKWLSSPPLAQAVLQVAPAHVSHGGEGAYYVYLRRQR